MIRSEFDDVAQRITGYWKRYGKDQMDILWNMIRRHGLMPGALSHAVDKLMEEYPPQRPPRLRSFADFACGQEPSQPDRRYSVGDWVEVDAAYSERVVDGRHLGQIEPLERSQPSVDFARAYLAASGPREQREAIKAFYMKRQAMGLPITDAERAPMMCPSCKIEHPGLDGMLARIDDRMEVKHENRDDTRGVSGAGLVPGAGAAAAESCSAMVQRDGRDVPGAAGRRPDAQRVLEVVGEAARDGTSTGMAVVGTAATADVDEVMGPDLIQSGKWKSPF